MMRGFSLLEVLMALAIISTTLIAVSMLTIGMPDALMNARMHRDALFLADSGFSREMARGSEGFSRIGPAASTTASGFEAVLAVTAVGDGSAKHIESTVSWETRWGLPQIMSLSGFATDYENAADYACSPFLMGDWDAPAIYVPSDSRLPFLAALAATRSYVIAVASSTADFKDPSLFVFKNTDALEPVAAFDSATSSKTGYIAIAASRTHAYALSAHACPSGVRCAALDTFSFAGGFALVGTIPVPPARSILYRDGRLYVGLRTNAVEPEFLIFDVSTTGQPTRIGSAEIGETVNDIASDGRAAYVATADNSASGNKALMAFDVTLPKEGMLSAQRSRQSGAGISQRLALSGTALYLGRSAPLNSKELYLFDRSDITHEVSAKDADSSVAGIAVRGFQAFVLTRTRLNRWQSENASDLQLTSSLPLPDAASGAGLACGGSRLFIAANESAGGRLLMLSGT